MYDSAGQTIAVVAPSGSHVTVGVILLRDSLRIRDSLRFRDSLRIRDSVRIRFKDSLRIRDSIAIRWVDSVRPPVPTPTPTPTPTPVPVPGTTKSLTGAQGTFDNRSSPYPAHTTVNAISASWPGRGNNPINWKAGPGGIWIGGTVTGAWDQATTPWSAYHSTAGMHVRSDSAVVQGFRVHDYGDGVRFMDHLIHYFTLRGSWFSDIHDDCFEDDMLKSGLVEDNFFDGCYIMVSSRAAKADQDTVTGVGDTLRIRNNVGRLKAFALTADGPNTGGGFFKVGNVYPERNVTLIVEGNVFRADSPPGTGSLCLNQHNKVAKASGNTLVWLGRTAAGVPTPYPCLPLPAGWALTTDSMVWVAAVTRWKAAHPAMVAAPMPRALAPVEWKLEPGQVPDEESVP